MRTSAKALLKLVPQSYITGIKNLPYLEGVLESNYNQPHRYYHNLDHIFDMLLEYLTFWRHSEIDYDRSMITAILFHDIVYDTKAPPGRNEERSAELACQLMSQIFYPDENGISGDIFYFGTLHRLIKATTHTKDLSQSPFQEQLISDLDMSVFDLPLPVVLGNRHKVKFEYQEDFSEREVLEGMISFGQKLLAQPKIYYTQIYSEDNARKMLLESIKTSQLELTQPSQRSISQISSNKSVR